MKFVPTPASGDRPLLVLGIKPERTLTIPLWRDLRAGRTSFRSNTPRSLASRRFSRISLNPHGRRVR